MWIDKMGSLLFEPGKSEVIFMITQELKNKTENEIQSIY